MDFVPASDEENDLFARQNVLNTCFKEEEAIYSDDERRCSVPNLLLSSSAPLQECHGPIEGQPLNVFNRATHQHKSRLLRTRRPSAEPHRRLLVSAAVKEAANSTDEQPAGLIAKEVCPPLAEALQQRKIIIPLSKRAPNFIGRQPLPKSEWLSPLQVTETVDTSGSQSAGVMASKQPILTSRKTSDGLNVVFRKKAETIDMSAQSAQVKNPNTGWGNNFVRINLKKGHGSTSYKPSRQSNKRKRRGGGRGRFRVSRLRQVGDGSEYMEGWSNKLSRMECYKCGGLGHMSQDCTFEEDPWAISTDSDLEKGTAIEEEENQGAQLMTTVQDVAAEYSEIGANPSLEALTTVLQTVFGHVAFRGLQVETVNKLLEGHSCLSIQPTGVGKSLCYQLPALLFPGLTLVVSPLIALMLDQCASVPKELPAAVLWSGQSPKEALTVLSDVKLGLIKVLFVSPERLQNPHLIEAIQPRLPLPLVVVDEAHCVAEWGHSFRPAYFRLGTALANHIKADRILALTATATRATEEAVCSVLRIPQSQVLRDSAVRSNLRLTVSAKPKTSQGCWTAIARLLKEGALSIVSSVIVYCCFKEDANQLSRTLVASGIRAAAYHAGKSYEERAAIEKAFSSGRLRVCCATVAFGMGINIAGIGAVVHATVPRSLEEYVQQIGRAGRDGSEAVCYAYIDDGDFIKLRSLAHSAVVDKGAIESLLDAVFETAECGREDDGMASYGVLPLKKLSTELDVQEDTIEGVLSYLEAHEHRLIRLFPPTALAVKVSFYSTPAEEMAQDCDIVAALLSAASSAPRNGVYTVLTTKLAAAARRPPGMAVGDLQKLAVQKLIGFQLSGGDGPAFQVLSKPEDRRALASNLSQRLQATLSCHVGRLDACFKAFSAALQQESGSVMQEKILRDVIDGYFDNLEPVASLTVKELPLKQSNGSLLTAAKAVVRKNREQDGPQLSVRAIAKILHGIGGSAGLSADQWRKRMGAFFGSQVELDFSCVLKAAELAMLDCN